MNERIAEIRKAAGMTQEEFAVKIGLSRNFIWMIEKGDRVPSDRTIRDICDKFNVSEDWLRRGNGPMRPESSADEELSQIWADIEKTDDVLVKAIVTAYWKLDEKDKAAVRKLVDRFVEEMNKKKSPGE